MRNNNLKVLKYLLLPNKNTLFVGKVLHHFPTLDSTNKYASELLAKSKPIEGTVISTDHQTAGRGQIGSKWESQPGKNITLSLILYPDFLSVRRQFSLNLAISLAVRDFLAKYSQKQLKIKWPNDICFSNRKIGGILIQNTLSGAVFSASVIGIGVNINQEHFPDDLPNPTSLKLQTGRTYELEVLIPELCKHLEFRYLQLRQGKEDQLKSDYYRHLLWYRKEALFRFPAGGEFPGRIVAIDDEGKLNVETGGETRSFGFKEIVFCDQG